MNDCGNKYKFSMGKGVNRVLSGTDFSVNIMQATDQSTQFVNAIKFRGHWIDIIIVKAPVPTQGETDESEIFFT
jgi:hypothetical protein